MKTINKKILVPIITSIALLAKYTLGYEIPDVAVDLTADLIMGAITLAGIFMHPMNPVEEEAPQNVTQEPTNFISNNK